MAGRRNYPADGRKGYYDDRTEKPGGGSGYPGGRRADEQGYGRGGYPGGRRMEEQEYGRGGYPGGRRMEEQDYGRGGYPGEDWDYGGDGYPRGDRRPGQNSYYEDSRQPVREERGPYDYEEFSARNDPRRKKRRKKRRKWLFALEVFLLLFVALGLFAGAQLYRMDRVKLKDILVNNLNLSGDYRNIALFGVDSREGNLESGTNSDTIIICSINKKTKDVKLVSVYRDTYLDNTDGSYRKATECYSIGGARQSVNMLNTNLDLNIEDFVTVDFNAIVEMVDLVGGIDMEITEEELQWLNGYCVENSQVTGVPYEPLAAAGYQHLNGIQALAYCRIRYTEGWDYKRTDRQREVLGKILDKAKSQPLKIVSIANKMIPNIATSLGTTEMIGLAAGIMGYNIQDSTGFPFDKATADIAAGDCVIPVNLAANVSQLHAWLFGEENYTPSDTVQQISSRIISDTGIQ